MRVLGVVACVGRQGRDAYARQCLIERRAEVGDVGRGPTSRHSSQDQMAATIAEDTGCVEHEDVRLTKLIGSQSGVKFPAGFSSPQSPDFGCSQRRLHPRGQTMIRVADPADLSANEYDKHC